MVIYEKIFTKHKIEVHLTTKNYCAITLLFGCPNYV